MDFRVSTRICEELKKNELQTGNRADNDIFALLEMH